MSIQARIRGSGVFVPDGVVTNERMSRLMDTTDEWIQQRTGIRERHYARKGTSSADLGHEAAKRALESAGLAASDVDLIVFATMTPAHYFPGNGGIVAAKLGLSSTPALDIRMQCAGFLSGLQVSDAFIRSGTYRRVLLIGAECHAAFYPWSDAEWRIMFGETEESPSAETYAFGTSIRDRAVIFGDAAGAFLLEANDSGNGRGFLGFEMRTDGHHWDKLFVPSLGSASFPYVTKDALDAHLEMPVVEGRQVFKLATTAMPAIVREITAKHGFSRRRPVASPDAPGQPAHQRGRPESSRAFGRSRLQQHPEVRQHDGRDAAARLPRGEGGWQSESRGPRLLHRARRRPSLGRRTRSNLIRSYAVSQDGGTRSHAFKFPGRNHPFGATTTLAGFSFSQAAHQLNELLAMTLCWQWLIRRISSWPFFVPSI